MTIVQRLRLIADEGMILTNGTVEGTVIDCNVGEEGLWKEVPMPEPEPIEDGSELEIGE